MRRTGFVAAAMVLLAQPALGREKAGANEGTRGFVVGLDLAQLVFNSGGSPLAFELRAKVLQPQFGAHAAINWGFLAAPTWRDRIEGRSFQGLAPMPAPSPDLSLELGGDIFLKRAAFLRTVGDLDRPISSREERVTVVDANGNSRTETATATTYATREIEEEGTLGLRGGLFHWRSPLDCSDFYETDDPARFSCSYTNTTSNSLYAGAFVTRFAKHGAWDVYWVVFADLMAGTSSLSDAVDIHDNPVENLGELPYTRTFGWRLGGEFYASPFFTSMIEFGMRPGTGGGFFKLSMGWSFLRL